MDTHPDPVSLPEGVESPGGSGTPALPPGVRVVGERVTRVSDLELHAQPEWAEELPWLIQGTTARGSGDDPFDLAFFGRGGGAGVRERWRRLRDALAVPRIVHGRQVHGSVVRFHSGGPPGLHLCPDADGHVTRTPGTLVTVATADCVPIFVVDSVLRAVAVLHGGWRGVAAGVLERGLEVMEERLASRLEDLRVHLGPAICGRCYEVGPEVHGALGLPVPEEPTPVDLRAVVATRAVEAGVGTARVTVSDACTRCGGSVFFSHRAGDAERQLAFVGVDPTGPGAA